MSLVQILIIGVGVLIALSSLDLSSVKAYLNKQEVENKPISPPVQVVVVNQKDELVSIVQKWQALKDACEKSKLTEASAKLDEIFPVLIKVEKQ